MMIPVYVECKCCGAGQLAQVQGHQKLASIQFSLTLSNPCFNCGYTNHPYFSGLEIPVKMEAPKGIIV